MRSRHVCFLFLVLTIGFLLLFAGSASAQTDEAVRVIYLSSNGHERGNAVSFSPDGRLLAVGISSGVELFDTGNLSTLDFIQTNSWARSVVFLPGANTLAAGLFDNTIKIWHLPDAQLVRTFEEPQGWVRSISVSRDGSLIASASDDDTVRVWKTADGVSILILDKDTGGVRAVALSPDGQFVVAALDDTTVRVWRVANGELLYTLTGHEGWVRCLAFSPDGALLASGSFDKTVRLWSVADGKLLHTLEGHTASVLGVTFSPDGKTLASGSVDGTARLWQAADGSPIRVLQGHTDFVYAVAFSPDGKTLATGGADNAVRLWDLEKLSAEETTAGTGDNPTVQNEAEHQAVSSDCRLCHHPRGKIEPPRVIELSCEGCHTAGIGQAWCIAFPRSTSVTSTLITYVPTNELSGVPVGDNEVAVVIASPGNGETLYVKGNYTAPEFIAGKVFYAGQSLITDIEIRLDILSGAQKVTSLVTHPSRNGDYNFNVAINPGFPPPFLSRPGTRTCLVCHGDFLPEAGLPKGKVRIVVTAATPDGKTASDQRWIRIDSSGKISVPVQVIDEDTGKPVGGLNVQAATILYEWRGRFDNAATDQSGNAKLSLEVLSQAPTTYTLDVPPIVLNGLFYTSVEPVRLKLDSNATSAGQITLKVHTQIGQVTGKVIPENKADNLSGTEAWAIQLPVGPVYQTSFSNKNDFSFDNIPVSQYVITLDQDRLAKSGYRSVNQYIDLFGSPQETISFELAKSPNISVKINSENDGWLPFGWLVDDLENQAQPISPISGGFLIPVPSTESWLITVSAPGYYSQIRRIDSRQPSIDFQLVPRPETRLLAWGNGEIVIPPETQANWNGLNFTMDQGWMWGQGQASQSLQIDLPDFRIMIPGGKFALELSQE
ncbi:MAG: WD40 repeat domain-containing protein, partial [Anaerolineales bacterium]|nr:WD40 repeat domain-containing protein [Anaerolineales bacterium]